MSNKSSGYGFLLGFVFFGLLASGVVFLWWLGTRPEPSEPFEMEGEFVTAQYSGSLNAGAGEAWNTTAYELVVSSDEYSRVESKYTKPTRKSYGLVEGRDGYMYYARESTGNWCGPLPSRGALVRVNSPTGHTRDVVIMDLETGKEYRSQGDCERPMLTFHYRITNQETGEVAKEGTVSGHDSFDASKGYQPDYPFVLQMWQEGEAPPPLLPTPTVVPTPVQ